jgi:hypothetical protein
MDFLDRINMMDRIKLDQTESRLIKVGLLRNALRVGTRGQGCPRSGEFTEFTLFTEIE